MYQSSLKNKTIPQEIESAVASGEKQVENIVKDPKGAFEKAQKA